jgi:hypothetical protein
VLRRRELKKENRKVVKQLETKKRREWAKN